jgi:hypothetical protein
MTLTNQHWETLAALAADPGADINEACLEALRAKHLVGKKNLTVTTYGRTRLARHLEQPEQAPARKSAKKLEAQGRGYSTRQIGNEWHIVDRFGQVLHHATYTSDRDAKVEADRLTAALVTS